MLGVAATLEHDGLAVPADVGQQLDPRGRIFPTSHQHARVVVPGERVVVADVGHHQLVADVV